MREYEFMFIVAEEGSSRKVHEPVVEEVRTLLEGLGGRVLRIRPWGLRQFAYPIRKMRYGYYVIMQILIAKEQLPEFERKLKLNEKIVRYLLTYLDERIDEDAPVVMSPSAELQADQPSEAKAEIDVVDFEETVISTEDAEVVSELEAYEEIEEPAEPVDEKEPVEDTYSTEEEGGSDLEEPEGDAEEEETGEVELEEDILQDVDFGDDLQKEIDKLEEE